MANIKPRLWVFGVVTGCFVRHLRFPHLITDGAIKGKNTCCIADVTKGQRVISETCHFNRLSSVILADFSSGSRAFLFLGMTRRSRGRGFKASDVAEHARYPAASPGLSGKNKLNSHRCIVRLPVREARRKRSLKGDGLSKQNILASCLLCYGVDSSTQPKISALTFCSAQTTRQCVHCARGREKLKAKGTILI